MSKFSISIQEWYRQNHRDLPWRNTSDPYRIWLSEIILQQTRVDQGRSYYNKFIQHYPTVVELANAKEHEVLNLWQGLGYYSRARNLHYAAQQIVEQFKGEFPSSFKEIKSLKGVGDYTAAAIASFSYRLPHAVVDGNVYRVLARYLNLDLPIDSTKGKKTFATAAQELLDPRHPDIHNQAIMELGALVCTPKNPKCESCPVQSSCTGFKANTQLELPVKVKKTKVKHRYHYYFILADPNTEQLLIKKRTNNDIWKNMYDFPSIESEKQISPSEQYRFLKELDLQEYEVEKVKTLKHKLSHREINATFFQINAPHHEQLTSQFIAVSMSDLSDYPLPRLIDKFLENYHPFFTH